MENNWKGKLYCPVKEKIMQDKDEKVQDLLQTKLIIIIFVLRST